MKKMIISILAATLMLSSVCGCARDEDKVNPDGSTNRSEAGESGTEADEEGLNGDALAAADEFASGAVACDLTAMEEVCDESFSSMWDQWGYYLSFQDADNRFTEDQCTALCAIRDTFSYTIDEDSVEISDGQVYVDVIFSMADYETAYENAASRTVGEFLTELDEADTVEMEVTLCIREEDGELVCCNYRRTLNMLYEFTTADLSFNRPVADYVTGELEWRYEDYEVDGHPVYEDPLDIWVFLQVDDSYDEGMDGVRCEVVYEGETVYTEYDSRSCTLYSGMIDVEGLVQRGFLLPEGEYEFTFYDINDNVLASDTCTVELTGYRPQIHVEWTDYNSSFLEESDMHDMTSISVELYADNVSVRAMDFTAEITYNGEVFYQETMTGDVMIFIRPGADPYYPDDGTGTLFAPGEYTVTFYDEWGNVYGTSTRTIS